MKMKKIILMMVLCFSALPLQAQMKPAPGEEKEWVLDPKTSMMIPKFLGKIKVLRGQAIIGDRELKQGSKIYNNDLLQTKENSFVVMEMVDLTTVTLGPSSDFKVSNWTYRTKNDREAEFNVLKGQWRAFVREKSKDMDQLKIKTPVVSMGIRGTELMINVLKDKEKDLTQIALIEGSIHMETADGKKQDLAPGDHAVIVKGQKGFEHKDKKLTPEELKTYLQTTDGIPRLLDPDKSVLVSENTHTAEVRETDKNGSVDDALGAKKPKEKTVKENLQILNTTREKNRKNK